MTEYIKHKRLANVPEKRHLLENVGSYKSQILRGPDPITKCKRATVLSDVAGSERLNLLTVKNQESLPWKIQNNYQ